MDLPGADVFERSGLKAWPGIEFEIEWDGAWIRRAAKGYTKRAHSVQSLDPADDAEARIGAGVDWFKAHSLPPVFRVTPPAGPHCRSYEVLDPDYLARAQRLQNYSEDRLYAGLGYTRQYTYTYRSPGGA